MDKLKRLLIVVDMQNDFIDGALGTAEAAAIVPDGQEKIEEYQGEDCEIPALPWTLTTKIIWKHLRERSSRSSTAGKGQRAGNSARRSGNSREGDLRSLLWKC